MLCASHTTAFRRATSRNHAALALALLHLEVHVHESEAVPAQPGVPLEVVHRAPLKVTLHRHALGGHPLLLRQVRADEHDAVGVVDVPVGGQLVFRRAAVLGDVDFPGAPERVDELRAPVQGHGVEGVPPRDHFRVRPAELDLAPAWRFVGTTR